MNQLIDIMLKQEILNDRTVITATYSTKDNTGRIVKKQGTFVFIDAVKQGNEYSLSLTTLSGGNAMNILATDIIAIDGMKPDRFVDVYDINIDGTIKNVGKKRGRRSKTLI
jgi:hypothetical protein